MLTSYYEMIMNKPYDAACRWKPALRNNGSLRIPLAPLYQFLKTQPDDRRGKIASRVWTENGINYMHSHVRTWDWSDRSLSSSGIGISPAGNGNVESGSLRLGLAGRLGARASNWALTWSAIWSCWSGSKISSLRLGLDTTNRPTMAAGINQMTSDYPPPILAKEIRLILLPSAGAMNSVKDSRIFLDRENWKVLLRKICRKLKTRGRQKPLSVRRIPCLLFVNVVIWALFFHFTKQIPYLHKMTNKAQPKTPY